jgi:integrase
MQVELSDRFVAGAKPGDYFDSKMRGLQVRVAPTGVKSWSVIFTSPTDGKRARLSLGRYPSTSLARARRLAGEAHGQIERGIDPRAASGLATGMTVAMLAEAYLRKHVSTLRGSRELERRLRVDVLPVIGSVKLADLHRRDVHRFLDPIVERGAPVSARRVFDDFRAMVRWAVARGDMDSNPLSGARPPATSAPRERVLDDLEVGLLWRAWSTVFSEPMALALKLALATGQRIGEVCGLTLSEIDFTKSAWTIPASRAKNKHAHVVPLSDLALALIEEARTDGDDQLFKITAGRVAAILVERRKLLPVKDWTSHDLRRTALTGMAKLGVDPLVLGHIANHRTTTRAGMTLAVYVRYDYGREKAAALDQWGERLAAIVGAGAAKVLPLRGKA